MTTKIWDMALDVYVQQPQVDLGQALVALMLTLDSFLRDLAWWIPSAVLRGFLNGVLGITFSGVWWFEFSPWAFYLIWLPAATSRYVLFVWGFGRLLREFAYWLWILVLRRTTLGWLLELSAAWLLRGSLAPPPVLRADEVPGLATDKGENRAHILGMGFAQEANVAHASVAAGGLTPSRHRGRSVWTNRLQAYLGGRPGVVGDLVNRRWKPDLPEDSRPLAANALLGLLDLEAKLLGGGVLPSTGDSVEVFLVVETAKGRCVVAPTLLAHLSLYACFRPRSQDLLAGLRSRAREWFAEKEISALAAAFVLPDTVALSFSPTAPEKLASERLDAFEVPPSA